MDSIHLNPSKNILNIDLSAPPDQTYKLSLTSASSDPIAYRITEVGSSNLSITPNYGQIEPFMETDIEILFLRSEISYDSSNVVISSFSYNLENFQHLTRFGKFENAWDYEHLLGAQNCSVKVVYFNSSNIPYNSCDDFRLSKLDMVDMNLLNQKVEQINAQKLQYAEMVNIRDTLKSEVQVCIEKKNKLTLDYKQTGSELQKLKQEADKYTAVLNSYKMILDTYEGSPAIVSKLTPKIILHTDTKLYKCLTALEFAKEAFYKKKIVSVEVSCVICYQNSIQCIIYPCKHVCVCQICIVSLKSCPCCRTKVKKYDSAYIQTGL